ncbi:MAG TPA: DUF885 domain-containing protein [Gammaproteobacteria bacterium]|nr:DUF885 domain-containing protein [Gammaproteobacteria bacterium]
MNDTVQDFEQICADYYASWYRFHPQAAVEIGIYTYAGSLPPYDENSHRALIVLHEELITALDELSSSELDPDHLLDYQVLQGAAYLERKNLLLQDWRYHRPQDYLPIHALYQLQIRPLPDAAKQFLLLLQATPEYLSGARQLLSLRAEQIPAIWAKSAVAEATAGADFIDSLAVVEQWQQIPDLEYELQEASRAVREFATFIQHELCPRAQGVFACGREYFEDLLHFQHGLPITVDALYAFGQQLFEETRQALLEVESQLRGDGEPAVFPQALFTEHPQAKSLIRAYQQAMVEARSWLQEHRLVTMPVMEDLRVIETPEFLRHRIPFAAYQEPAPNDPAQQGYYYVTPAQGDELSGHNTVAIRHTSVHEAYPGHHLQFVTANMRSTSRTPIRLLNASATLYEGWALYCEMLMSEQGFLDQPLSRYVLLRDRLWRALRVLIDIDLHVNQLSAKAAAQRMVDELGFEPQQARAEVAWYTESPTVPMSYATGWSMICKLRVHQQQQQGFDLTRFHDQLLSCGSVALLVVIQHVFGVDTAQNIVNDLFTNTTK